MKNLLIGNGIDIQYGGKDYLNKSIVRRAINKLNKGNFPSEIYPKEIGQWLYYLYDSLSDIITKKYDKYVVASYEKQSLTEFKNRYKNSKKIDIHDIGIEDYFFIHELFCRKNKIVNPENFDFRWALKCLFVDSIYNEGEINKIKEKFPDGLRNFLLSYDNIFTTNYDNNIEKFTAKKINYLHGAFHILDEVYNPNSFRNMLSDEPIKKATIIEGYDYLYSNVLMTFSGDLKEFSINRHSQ